MTDERHYTGDGHPDDDPAHVALSAHLLQLLEEETAEEPELEAMAQYAGALEAIIRAMPGSPVVNGRPMATEDALEHLRRRFDVDGQVIDQATLAAGIATEKR